MAYSFMAMLLLLFSFVAILRAASFMCMQPTYSNYQGANIIGKVW